MTCWTCQNLCICNVNQVLLFVLAGVLSWYCLSIKLYLIKIRLIQSRECKEHGQVIHSLKSVKEMFQISFVVMLIKRSQQLSAFINKIRSAHSVILSSVHFAIMQNNLFLAFQILIPGISLEMVGKGQRRILLQR